MGAIVIPKHPTSYDELISVANEARIATEDIVAIDLYRKALKIGGPRDIEIRWMLGVRLASADQPTKALEELDAVLEACPDESKPGVLRDRSRVLAKLGRSDEASKDIAESLSRLDANGDKAEYGATLGFGARLRLNQGDIQGALVDFKAADNILKQTDNRHFELYNKLHYAEALLKHGDKALAGTVLAEAELLIPIYGGRKHSEQAERIYKHLS